MTASAAVGIALAWPTVLFAATPDGGVASGPAVEPGSDGWLGGMLGVVLALSAWALAIVVLAFVLSRIGPRRTPDGEPRVAPAASVWVPTSLATGAASLAVWIPVTILGMQAGRAMARYANEGGMSAVSAGVIGLLLGLLVVSLLAVAAVARLLRRDRVSRAIAVVIVTAAILPAAALAGGATAGPSAHADRVAVVLQSSGWVRLALDAPAEVAFAPADSAPAACNSVPDGRAVGAIGSVPAGHLGSAVLEAGITLGTDAASDAVARLILDMGVIVDGGPRYGWIGAGVGTSAADGMSGSVSFGALPLRSDADKPGISLLPREIEDAWPPTLSGVLTWTCDPWPG